MLNYFPRSLFSLVFSLRKESVSLLFKVRSMLKIDPIQILFNYIVFVPTRKHSFLEWVIFEERVSHELTVEIVDMYLGQFKSLGDGGCGHHRADKWTAFQNNFVELHVSIKEFLECLTRFNGLLNALVGQGRVMLDVVWL